MRKKQCLRGIPRMEVVSPLWAGNPSFSWVPVSSNHCLLSQLQVTLVVWLPSHLTTGILSLHFPFLKAGVERIILIAVRRRTVRAAQSSLEWTPMRGEPLHPPSPRLQRKMLRSPCQETDQEKDSVLDFSYLIVGWCLDLLLSPGKCLLSVTSSRHLSRVIASLCADFEYSRVPVAMI